MPSTHTLGIAAALLATVAVAAGAAAQPAQPPARAASDSFYVAQARADSMRRPYTAADIRFMSGMIGHHAQAITMSRMAPTHGASEAVRTLAARIINAQTDEIALMQQWLRDRRQPVPEPFPSAGMSDMPGMPGMEAMHHEMMPGMLTEEQMRQLDAARGAQFDELFLRFMIQHHSGAVTMVKSLFDTEGAGQDELVFKFASDVNVDQSTEIARMERMLAAMLLSK
jgi:uncharacterized protein (DUF305 family)